MRSVKISRDRLLETLKRNRETHLTEFNEAMEGFKSDAIAAMKKNLELAETEGKIVLTIFDVIQPTSYAESYNTIISMLEYSEDEVVELTMQEFSQYVEDKWNWKAAFAETASFYNNKRAF